MEQLYRFHNRTEEPSFSVHDHQLMVAALLGKTGELRTGWSSLDATTNVEAEGTSKEAATHPSHSSSILEHDTDWNPSESPLESQQVCFTMRRGPSVAVKSGKSRIMKGDSSPWMCYVHQVWHPWITVGDYIPERVLPYAAKSTGALLPKDVARMLSKQQLVLNASLKGFTTQPMKQLDPYLSHFYGMTPEGLMVKRVPESKYIENLLTPTVLAGFFADVGRILGRDELLFEVSHWEHDLSSLHRMVNAFQKAHGWSLEARVWENLRPSEEDQDSGSGKDNSNQKSYYLVLAPEHHQEFLQYIAKELLLMGLMGTIRYYPLRQQVRRWGKTAWQHQEYLKMKVRLKRERELKDKQLREKQRKLEKLQRYQEYIQS